MKIRLVSVVVCLLALVFGLIHEPPASADESPRVVVPKTAIEFDDGDTITIRWPGKDEPEVVRILGIDTPEVMHLEHSLPYPQAFGAEAAGFLRGCLAVAEKVELLRSSEQDPFKRTLGYLFMDGKNYSVLAIRARLAVETVGHYGDNGLPVQAAECVAAAKTAGPVAFEAPHVYRRRMRAVSKWLKDRGLYPHGPEGD